MTSQNLWQCVTALASALNGSRAASEAALDKMEGDLKLLNPDECRQMRLSMTIIVAHFARLEMRLIESIGTG